MINSNFLIVMSVVLGLVLIWMVFTVYKYVKKVDLVKKELTNKFVSENANSSLNEIHDNFHLMYNKLDSRTKNSLPVDVLWNHVFNILKDLNKI